MSGIVTKNQARSIIELKSQGALYRVQFPNHYVRDQRAKWGSTPMLTKMASAATRPLMR
jgi:hypothetical protein